METSTLEIDLQEQRPSNRLTINSDEFKDLDSEGEELSRVSVSVQSPSEEEEAQDNVPSSELNMEIVLDQSHLDLARSSSSSSSGSNSMSMSLTIRSSVSQYERIMMRHGLSAVLPYEEKQRGDRLLLKTVYSDESFEGLAAQLDSDQVDYESLFLRKKTMSLRVSSSKGTGIKFKFVEYCPDVFHAIRQCSNMSEKRYLNSVGLESPDYITFKSNSKSGQFFFLSRDQRLVIKTISKNEYKIFRAMLRGYYEHLKQYHKSLLVRILGLYQLKASRISRRLYFIVMANVCSGEGKHTIDRKYDLKGSHVGRAASAKEMLKDSPVLKDQDFSKILLSLGRAKTDEFLQQLDADCAYLSSAGLMDYSLFVAIHFMDKCEHSHKRFVEKNKDRLSPSVSVSPQQYESGHLGHVIYYFGLIDFFTTFTVRKKMENFIKAIVYDESDISAVSPRRYGRRLFHFVRDHLYRK